MLQVPALELPNGELFDSNAIAFYLANEKLRGENELTKAQVIQWSTLADSELLPAVFAWVLPATGATQDQEVYKLFKKYDGNLIISLNRR